MPRGRPALPEEEKRQLMAVKLDPSMLLMIEEKMEKTGLSKTAVVENLLFNSLASAKTPTAEKELSSNPDVIDENDSSPNDEEEEWWDGGFEAGKKAGLTERIKEGKLQSKELPSKHNALPAFIPICPNDGCGKKNPNFPGLEKLARCDDCKMPVGTEQEIKNDIVGGVKGGDCPFCGGKDARMPE